MSGQDSATVSLQRPTQALRQLISHIAFGMAAGLAILFLLLYLYRVQATRAMSDGQHNIVTAETPTASANVQRPATGKLPEGQTTSTELEELDLAGDEALEKSIQYLELTKKLLENNKVP